ncbi:MAG TPA: cation:proton antiporter [Polyangiaceae bacterium]|nr:cation:proton antiporter [Polyangiaceae bacterium]
MPHLEFNALTVLLAQISAILVASRLLALPARLLGQPLVVAEMTAGIALGPSVLGRLWPGATEVLFPSASLAVLKVFSQIGLLLFMFLVGLDLDPKMLRGRASASVFISHSSIIVPFALGAAVARILYADYAAPDVPMLAFVLFFGAAMSITAFPVLARILSERKLMNSRIGAMALACAAVDDVSAWCILAVVVAVAGARDAVAAYWTCGLTASFTLLLLYVVRPALRRLATSLSGRGGMTPGWIGFSLGMLLLSAGLTELIGIHALFGAFIWGVVVPREEGWARTLVEKLETAVLLLMPLFFAFSGLRTQVGLLSGGAQWLVTLALLACATLGKVGGSAVAGRLTGLRWREAGAIGVLMNTRGLMELVVLNIGLDLGVISPTVFAMLVVVALVTTIATTPLLKWVYPHRELAVEASQAGRAGVLVRAA